MARALAAPDALAATAVGTPLYLSPGPQARARLAVVVCHLRYAIAASCKHSPPRRAAQRPVNSWARNKCATPQRSARRSPIAASPTCGACKAAHLACAPAAFLVPANTRPWLAACVCMCVRACMRVRAHKSAVQVCYTLRAHASHSPLKPPVRHRSMQARARHRITAGPWAVCCTS